MTLLKKHFILSLCGACLLLSSNVVVIAANDRLTAVYSQLEFDMPKVEAPQFKNRTFNVLDYGAAPDGKTLNTTAFAKAIEAASQKGGGTVLVPRGMYLTGPIVLKDNINFHTQAGALIIFSRDKTLYPLVETSFEGLNTVRCMSPIYAKGAKNIALSGNGIFDGNGQAWRFVKKGKLTEKAWQELVKSGGVLNAKKDVWYPSAIFKEVQDRSNMNVPTHLKTMEEFEQIRDFLRPVMVSLISCKNVLLDGPTFQNSPAWNIHPLMCENLIVRNLTVRNPPYSQNGDGIDIESCKNVLVYNCNFDVGDDAICIKSGKDKDGRDRAMPTENLVIFDCVVYHGHGGVVLGSEMSGGVKNMHVSNCTFMGTDVGLRFKSTRGRGGVVENIYISDIEMINIPATAISFNMYYGGKSVSEAAADGDTHERILPPVSEETPQFKDIYMTNVRCIGASKGIVLQGLPEMNLENVNLTNVHVEAQTAFYCADAAGVHIKNLLLKGDKSPIMHIENSKEVQIDGLDFSSDKPLKIKITGSSTEQISIKNSALSNLKNDVELGKEAKKDEISIKN